MMKECENVRNQKTAFKENSFFVHENVFRYPQIKIISSHKTAKYF